MTPQVEIRQEYDKLVKAVSALENKDDFTANAEGGAKDALDFIWKAAENTKNAIEAYAGKTDAPPFTIMQNVPKDGQSQSAVTEFPYYVKDASISVSIMTFGFKVTNISADEKTADAHFMLSVSGTATDKDGNVLKTGNNNITYTSMVMLLISPPFPVSLHSYKVSADSDAIPVYNLIFNYIRKDGKWIINDIKDSGVDVFPIQSPDL